MHTYLMEMLECPVCHGTLQWDVLDEEGDRIEEGIAAIMESFIFPTCGRSVTS